MNRISYLDGVRGVAALIVVLHHLMLAFYPAMYTGIADQAHIAGGFETWYSHSVLGFLLSGNFAVCIFFVLSGFVLSYPFFRSQRMEVVSSQLVRRYFRLNIPIFFSITVAMLLIHAGLLYHRQVSVITHSEDYFGQLWRIGGSIKEYLSFGLFDSVFTGNNKFNPVLWTMGVEFKGSFLVFGLIATSVKLEKKYWFYLALSFVLLWFHQMIYICFIAGVFLAETHLQDQNRTKPQRISTPGFIGLFLLGLFFGSYPTEDSNLGPLYSKLCFNHSTAMEAYHTLGAVFLIASVIYLPGLQRFFNSAACQFLGRISFSLYLIHVLIIGSLGCKLFLMLDHRMSYHAAALVASAVSIIVTLLASYLMAKFIDEPAVRFSKFVSGKFVKSKAATT